VLVGLAEKKVPLTLVLSCPVLSSLTSIRSITCGAQVATLKPGQTFGEQTLCNPTGAMRLGALRAAAGVCDFYVLTRDSLEQVLSLYPIEAHTVQYVRAPLAAAAFCSSLRCSPVHVCLSVCMFFTRLDSTSVCRGVGHDNSYMAPARAWEADNCKDDGKLVQVGLNVKKQADGEHKDTLTAAERASQLAPLTNTSSSLALPDAKGAEPAPAEADSKADSKDEKKGDGSKPVKLTKDRYTRSLRQIHRMNENKRMIVLFSAVLRVFLLALTCCLWVGVLPDASVR
jgi:hypothetical protein